MADQFTNQTCSSFADFMTKLNSFVVTTMGWTAEDLDGVGTLGIDTTAGEAAWSKAAAGTNTNDIQVAFQWDAAGTPVSLGIYQYNHASGAGNYQSANNPYDQPTDSGNGAQSTSEASLVADRNCEIGSGGPVQFWAFAGTSPVEYVYVVVETTSGQYRHFGFGELQKFNDWTGGAFAYGYRHTSVAGGSVGVQVTSSYLLDGAHRASNAQKYCATINAEGLPNQVASGMYCIVSSIEQLYVHSVGNDRQTSPIARGIMQGGYRQSIFAAQYGVFPASPLTGFVPGYPIGLMYLDSSLSVDDWYGPMGIMDGVRGVNISQFEPGEDVTIGGVVWTMFPAKKKGTGTDSTGTGNQGMMYRKNVV